MPQSNREEPHELAVRQAGTPLSPHGRRTEPYETIGVEKLTPIIGAEISGVDIGKLVDDDAPPTARWTRSIARSPKIS